MTVVVVMELPSMTVIIFLELHSMTVSIVLTKRTKDANIHSGQGNVYVMWVCVGVVYEGLRNDCAYEWVVGMLRANGLYQVFVHLV